MTPIELKAMDVVNDLLKNQKIPMDRVKSIILNWEVIDGYYFPILNCQFYEDKSRWKQVFDE